jgi:hypothetical protein
MKVLVAGATGAIGRVLVRCLNQNRHTVFALVRSPASSRALTVLGRSWNAGGGTARCGRPRRYRTEIRIGHRRRCRDCPASRRDERAILRNLADLAHPAPTFVEAPEIQGGLISDLALDTLASGPEPVTSFGVPNKPDDLSKMACGFPFLLLLFLLR